MQICVELCFDEKNTFEQTGWINLICLTLQCLWDNFDKPQNTWVFSNKPIWHCSRMRGHAQPPILKTNNSQDTTKTTHISLAYDILASAGSAITYPEILMITAPFKSNLYLLFDFWIIRTVHVNQFQSTYKAPLSTDVCWFMSPLKWFWHIIHFHAIKLQ